MPSTSSIRNNVTLYLKKFDIDANKVLGDELSEEGYLYIADPMETRRGRPMAEFARDGYVPELRKWPSPTVYANVVRILAGGKPTVDVIEPANADAQREQRGPDAAVSGVTIVPNSEIAVELSNAGVEDKDIPAATETVKKLNAPKRTTSKDLP